MFHNIGTMMQTERGKTLISIILGIGLASLFRKTCTDKGCYEFTAPATREVEDTFYKHGSSCYTFTAQTTPCKKEKQVSFA